jgi:flagellar biosynthesis protein FlhG
LTWSIAGARGGTGKSLLAAYLGTDLAQRGWQVLLADLDWQGGNLQTLLGGQPSAYSVVDVAEGRGPDTPSALPMVCTGLRLIPGVSGFSDAPTLKSRRELLTLLRRLPCHHLVVDLGAGQDAGVVEPFLASDVPLLVTLPDAVGVENTWRFLGGLVRQRAVEAFLTASATGAIPPGRGGIGNVTSLAEVKAHADALEMPELYDRVVADLRGHPIYLVLNQVRRLGDLEVATSLEQVARRTFGCDLRTVGAIQYDEKVWIAMRKNRDLCAWGQVSKIGDDLRELVDALLMELGIPLGYKTRGVARVERRVRKGGPHGAARPEQQIAGNSH